MYRHLLVPLDGIDPRTGNTRTAIDLAQAVSARITFFLATPGLDELCPRLQDDDPEHPQTLLLQVRALAAEAGVACDTLHVCSDRPAEALLAAARTSNADLIVLPSHDDVRPGRLPSIAQAERMLREARLPLLVTRPVLPPQDAGATRAIGLIQEEHRSLAVVLRGMLRMVREARLAGPDDDGLDHVTLERMLHYVQTFPEQLHHPKEELVLHRLLRERHPDSVHLIEQLESDHAHELQLVIAFELALYDCPDGAAGQLDALLVLQTRLEQLARHVWQHMALEERRLLPLALAHLHASDWLQIATAFADHGDPRFGELSEESFRHFFASLKRLISAPIESEPELVLIPT